jgi:RNA polymerase sigma-54 factor
VQEIDWEQFLENRTLQQPSRQPRRLRGAAAHRAEPHEAAKLVDHLKWQLQMSDFTENERRFAELVLGNLDDNGFLDLKGTERENGERTPDITLEDLADARPGSTPRTRPRSSA